MDDTTEIARANARFYAAFAEQDLAAMDDVWAMDAPVVCIHPGWPALHERGDVMASWKAILGDLPGGDSPEVAFEEPSIVVRGEMAFVVCTERVGPHQLLATNVFVQEDGQWRVVHHHAAPVYAEEAPIGADDDGPRQLN